MTNQVVIDELERSDLVERRVQRFQQVDGRVVEGCRKRDDSAALRLLEDRRMPLPRKVRLVVEVV